METEQETIYYINGGCDLDELDEKETEYSKLDDDIPRELNIKDEMSKRSIYHLLEEYFEDELDQSEPWEDLTSKIQEVYKDLDMKLKDDLSYYVCCFVGKCKRFKTKTTIDSIKPSLKEIIVRLIKLYKKDVEPTKEHLYLLQASLEFANTHLQHEDFCVIEECIYSFKNATNTKTLLQEILYEII